VAHNSEDKTMSDPTRKAMLDVLRDYGDVDEFDVEEAIYWFASDYHGGQATNLYSVLSTSPYKPGPSTTGPSQDGMAHELYSALEQRFAG
jgi:hypothetical protein